MKNHNTKSISLAPERASLGEPRTASGRLTENRLAVSADHHGLRVAEHRSAAEHHRDGNQESQRTRIKFVSSN